MRDKRKSIAKAVSFEQASAVFVLYDYDKSRSTLSELERFCVAHRKIVLIGFSAQKRAQINASEEVICKDDFNWFLSPKTVSLKRFLVQDIDLVINLSATENTPLKLFMSLCRAKNRAGFGGTYTSCTDFIIHDAYSTSLVAYLENVIGYLNKIKNV